MHRKLSQYYSVNFFLLKETTINKVGQYQASIIIKVQLQENDLTTTLKNRYYHILQVNGFSNAEGKGNAVG
jgi:hypothetical protein